MLTTSSPLNAKTVEPPYASSIVQSIWNRVLPPADTALQQDHADWIIVGEDQMITGRIHDKLRSLNKSPTKLSCNQVKGRAYLNLPPPSPTANHLHLVFSSFLNVPLCKLDKNLNQNEWLSRLGEEILSIKQLLDNTNWPVPITLYILTTQGQSLPHDHHPANLGQALIYELCREIKTETKKYQMIFFDLPEKITPTNLDTFVQTVLSGSQHTLMAIRDNQCFANELQASNREEFLNHASHTKIYNAHAYANKSTTTSGTANTEEHIEEKYITAETQYAGLKHENSHSFSANGMPPTQLKNEPHTGQLRTAEIKSVGRKVKHLSVGSNVLLFNQQNARSAKVHIQPHSTVKIPAGITSPVALSLAEFFIPAMHLLKNHERDLENNTLVIHHAACHAGQALAQMAKLEKVTCICTVKNNAEKQLLQTLGIQKVINLETHSHLEELSEIPYIVDFSKESSFNNGLLNTFHTLSFYQEKETFESKVTQPEHNKLYHRYFKKLEKQLSKRKITLAENITIAESELTCIDWKMFSANNSIFPVIELDQTSRAHPPKKHTAIIQSDGSYLVTADSQTLCLPMLEWLVAEGAKSIIVITPLQTRQNFDHIIQRGVSLKLIDSSFHIAKHLDNILEEVQQEMGPLKGVISFSVSPKRPQKQCEAEKVKAISEKCLFAWKLKHYAEAISVDFFLHMATLPPTSMEAKQTSTINKRPRIQLYSNINNSPSFELRAFSQLLKHHQPDSLLQSAVRA